MLCRRLEVDVAAAVGTVVLRAKTHVQLYPHIDTPSVQSHRLPHFPGHVGMLLSSGDAYCGGAYLTSMG